MTVSGILFDLEGVLLRAKTHDVLPYANEMLAFCRERKIPFGIITNNTVQTPESILQILKERKLDLDEEQLLTPLKFLGRELGDIKTALVIGSDNLKEFVEKHNVKVIEASDVDAVICGGSYTISTDLLYKASTAILETKSRFLCLHRNRVFKDAEGITRPDVGCIVVGLEYSTGIKAKTLGKPSPECFYQAIKDWCVEPAEILLISDDPVSDLRGGKAAGFQTGFVSTGKYDVDILATLEPKPDMTWSSLGDALASLERR